MTTVFWGEWGGAGKIPDFFPSIFCASENTPEKHLRISGWRQRIFKNPINSDPLKNRQWVETSGVRTAQWKVVTWEFNRVRASFLLHPNFHHFKRHNTLKWLIFNLMKKGEVHTFVGSWASLSTNASARGQQETRHLLRPECLCPHKIRMLKPIVHRDGTRTWGLWEVIRSGG